VLPALVLALAAANPFALTLARASGTGSVSVGTTTRQLHSRLWVQRLGGTGAATGTASVACRTRPTRVGVGGLDTSFSVRLKPGGRMLLWRASGTSTCEVTVTLHGAGRLRVALRGY
jgi:hypothetical protein